MATKLEAAVAWLPINGSISNPISFFGVLLSAFLFPRSDRILSDADEYRQCLTHRGCLSYGSFLQKLKALYEAAASLISEPYSCVRMAPALAVGGSVVSVASVLLVDALTPEAAQYESSDPCCSP